MGCAASSQGSSIEHQNGNEKLTKNGHNPGPVIIDHVSDTKCSRHNNNCYNGKNGQVIRKATLTKHHSLMISDKSEEHARTGEEPAHPLPEADFGDMQLGISDAEQIQKILDSLDSDQLFQDPDFPADENALYYDTDSSHYAERIEWLRPKDIVSKPQLLVDGMSKEDIKQGTLGDCWFLSSCAAVSREERFMKREFNYHFWLIGPTTKKVLNMLLATLKTSKYPINPEIFRICPKDYPLYGDDYKGIVHFSFWRFGEWVDVYIDDLLPTRERQLVFAHCDDPKEFWVALIEKAYAKLHGSYEAIEGGQTMDALVDLTGGLAERYEITGADPTLYKLILSANKAGSFIACSKKGDWRTSQTADANGLVAGHAYTVTDAVKVRHKMGSEKLVRIRNPWGNETEWKGPWSDNDENWSLLDEQQKKKISFENRADGEFFMSYKDFCRQFQEITICTLGPDFDGDGSADKAGHVELARGEWAPGISAGGSRNDLESFSMNPQYLLTLKEPDEFDPYTDDPDAEGKCSIVIALMQEHRRSQRHLGVKTLQIGYILYKVNDPNQRLTANHFRYNYDSGRSGVYINYREVSNRFELDPGHYVVIPSTFNKLDSGSFLIRVFAQKHFDLRASPKTLPKRKAYN